MMNICDRRRDRSVSSESSHARHTHSGHRCMSGYVRRCIVLIVSATLLYLAPLVGCAGNQLTPEENQRYEQLNQELNEIRAERGQIERDVNQAFQKSGQLEKSKSLKGKQTLSCGYSIGGQALGPLPFKKRKGKNAKFGQGKSSKRPSCKSHTLRVK